MYIQLIQLIRIQEPAHRVAYTRTIISYLDDNFESLLLREAQNIQHLAVIFLHDRFEVLLWPHASHVPPFPQRLRLPLDGRARGRPHAIEEKDSYNKLGGIYRELSVRRPPLPAPACIP